MMAYIHPDGEWGRCTGCATAIRTPTSGRADRAAAVELDPDARLGLYAELAPMLFEDPMWIIAATRWRSTPIGTGEELRDEPAVAAAGGEVRLLRQVTYRGGASALAPPPAN